MALTHDFKKDSLVAPEVLSIDKDRKELVSLEILKFTEDTSELSEAEIKDLYERVTKEEFIKVDDLSQPYVLRLVTSTEKELRSLEPDFLPSGDDFEMAETIQDTLKENGINVYGGDFKTEDLEYAGEIKQQKLSDAIKQEMYNGLKELSEKTSADNLSIAKVDEAIDNSEEIDAAIEDAEIIEINQKD